MKTDNMKNKCDVCNEWHGSCASFAFADDVLRRNEHYVCQNCLMWSDDPLAKMARAHVRPVEAKAKPKEKAGNKKGGRNGNKQK